MNPITTPGEAVGCARSNLFVQDSLVCGVQRVIAIGLGVNMNTLNTDTTVSLIGLPGSNYIVTGVYVNNAVVNNGGTITNSMTTAYAAVYTAASAGGTAIVSAAALSGLSALTGAGGSLSMSLATTGFMFTQSANQPS